MKRIEDYAKEVTKSAGIHQGSEEEKIVHDSIYETMGGKYNPFNANSLNRYGSQVANKIIRTDGKLGRKIIPHLSNVLKDLK